MISIGDRQAMISGLSGGQTHDAPEGRALLKSWTDPVADVPMLMDRACEGDKTRQLVRDLGMTPVMQPKANRKDPWEFDREICKLRNEVERLFARLKCWGRVFTRYGNLDVMQLALVNIALIFDMILYRQAQIGGEEAGATSN